MTKEQKILEAMVVKQIPPPELVELSEEWLPWRYQVNTFGESIKYGHKENKIIRTGMGNYETKEAAEKAFKQAMDTYNKARG